MFFLRYTIRRLLARGLTYVYSNVYVYSTSKYVFLRYNIRRCIKEKFNLFSFKCTY